ncbi:MAG: ribulose 1,5-bisphosphate carboxylase large subunit [Nitrospira sp.]|uniref:Ribulose 1,5-bisphosphate carboxylase large subunit n=1 Tax=Nitrospira defluvii TaxID=330214 RepID=A0ABM8QZN3_9BACT|nr:RuBisCO large subunit C-terminal-like domain-containing protein [Nitrospira defluvii]MCS6328823.1 ribulose 1,5-bisphosphate carboxylase large subunit [Nitrospira sp.]CAE6725199.1 Ribulose 1,5-bisphosphate carboxylase large subunit [Nitrospira defluvii]
MTADQLRFSGQRFTVEYHLQGSAADARRRADLLCIDQTVEAADHVIPPGPIRNELLGRVEQFEGLDDEVHAASLTFPIELLDGTMSTLLHMSFGMASLQGGVRLVNLILPDVALTRMAGPRLGIAGLRAQLEVPARPLVCAVLKPLGLSPDALATLAYEFALGGVDLIKDDQSLGDHPFCPFEERVSRCAEAITSASKETGRTCLYAPHVFGPWPKLLERATLAKSAGAGALLICPGLTGYDAVATLSRLSAPCLPLILHPDFLGSHYVSPDSGIAPAVLFGLLPRFAGADVSIYPTYGLTYPITHTDCRGIAQACRTRLGMLSSTFPTAAGRMNASRIDEMMALYGSDVVFILGSDIRREPTQIRDACRTFRRLIETAHP